MKEITDVIEKLKHKLIVSCIGYYSDGKREFVAGGYGHILGDEGSAYWIGLRAVQAGIRAGEGRGLQTALRQRILDCFHETSFWGSKNGFIQKTFSVPKLRVWPFWFIRWPKKGMKLRETF